MGATGGLKFQSRKLTLMRSVLSGLLHGGCSKYDDQLLSPYVRESRDGSFEPG
tara:strand:- start:3869 stop:4027 length:159 start_codon:yes stop_codon:yes gene_type:complete